MKLICKVIFLNFLLLLLIHCKTNKVKEVYQIHLNKKITDSIKSDSQIINFIYPYKKQLDSIMNQPISYANVDFTKAGYSSNEGNLLADLVLEYAKKYTKTNNKPEPDFCLLNSGGIRTIIPRGVVTVENIFEVSPFENEMVLLQLEGSRMKEMFDYLRIEKKGHPLAGIKLVYKKDKLISAQIEGKNFDPTKKYWVVTIDYLMNGGDRMNFFMKSDAQEITHLKLRDILLEQVKNYKVLPDIKDQRLVFED
ncbi:hypothetical protein GFV01_08100 [Apibacter sp. B2912]|nr:hypothetical protein [Apibacter sp. B2912]